ncbi:MAG: hypothetical protein AAF299_06605, partial [Pseudomonadota bacterium]
CIGGITDKSNTGSHKPVQLRLHFGSGYLVALPLPTSSPTGTIPVIPQQAGPGITAAKTILTPQFAGN